jgi:hypothetical protein
MLSELKSIPEVWKKLLGAKDARTRFALSFAVFAVTYLTYFHFLKVWEIRPGSRPNDVILALFQPRDFSQPICILEYGGVLAVLVSLIPRPEELGKGFQKFALMTVLRTFCIYFVPLEPPSDMVQLADPVTSFALKGDVFVTKDLFFSGHTATLVLLGLIAPNRALRYGCFAAATVVGVLILWQHVHYTMDVLVAPVASYASYRLVAYLHARTGPTAELTSS